MTVAYEEEESQFSISTIMLSRELVDNFIFKLRFPHSVFGSFDFNILNHQVRPTFKIIILTPNFFLKIISLKIRFTRTGFIHFSCKNNLMTKFRQRLNSIRFEIIKIKRPSIANNSAMIVKN